jgi:hypothetical protein
MKENMTTKTRKAQNTNIRNLNEWKRKKNSGFHIKLIWTTTHENYKRGF